MFLLYQDFFPRFLVSYSEPHLLHGGARAERWCRFTLLQIAFLVFFLIFLEIIFSQSLMLPKYVPRPFKNLCPSRKMVFNCVGINTHVHQAIEICKLIPHMDTAPLTTLKWLRIFQPNSFLAPNALKPLFIMSDALSKSFISSRKSPTGSQKVSDNALSGSYEASKWNVFYICRLLVLSCCHYY